MDKFAQMSQLFLVAKLTLLMLMYAPNVTMVNIDNGMEVISTSPVRIILLLPTVLLDPYSVISANPVIQDSMRNLLPVLELLMVAQPMKMVELPVLFVPPVKFYYLMGLVMPLPLSFLTARLTAQIIPLVLNVQI
ncbi:MAG: hypothetical protein JKY09_00490 [Crocinitomicaceae bacterium]|nr:hypothetical protein [Crocinitomicaceae bacterium]